MRPTVLAKLRENVFLASIRMRTKITQLFNVDIVLVNSSCTKKPTSSRAPSAVKKELAVHVSWSNAISVNIPLTSHSKANQKHQRPLVITQDVKYCDRI